MSEFFEPLWDFLLNEWGTFGLVIASSIPTFLILLTIGIVWLVRKLFRKPKKTSQVKKEPAPASKAAAPVKKEAAPAPKAAAPVKKEEAPAPKADPPQPKQPTSGIRRPHRSTTTSAPAPKPAAPAPKPAFNVPDLKPELLYQKAGLLLNRSADNEAEALAYYAAAAEKAYPPAQFAIGKLYLDGGATVSPNESEALRWLAKAAENGHAPAQVCLGQYYLARKDTETANRWLKRAAENGSEEAAKLLK